MDKLEVSGDILKFNLTAPNRDSQYRKISGERQIKAENEQFHIEKFTDKQSFHENISVAKVEEFIEQNFIINFKQMEITTTDFIYSYRAAKKRILSSKRKNSTQFEVRNSQNRQKNYILNEDMQIAPLVELGIFTKDYKLIKSSFDKFRQINRFVEFIADVTKSYKAGDSINVIDFGCGKSYLTFVTYYYLAEIRQLNVKIIGLDLKADVIKKCNELAQKFNYKNLEFKIGDISEFKRDDTPLDMVITLHACDTATDYALFNAIRWNSKIILSVPCCQHEINKSFKSNNFPILSDYGIIQERISSLLTDAIRGKLLESSGYKTQLMEFIDFSHTPKNILIRAVKSGDIDEKRKIELVKEVEALQKEYNFSQKLYNLLK